MLNDCFPIKINVEKINNIILALIIILPAMKLKGNKANMKLK